MNFFNSVADQEYPGSTYQGRNDHGEIANPGFIPVTQFNPYAMMYQQQPKFSNGWSYFFGYPSLINPAAAPSRRQFDEDDEEFKQDFKDEVVKQGAPTPVPACGTGPSIFPTTKQLLASERVTGVGAIKAKKGAWPFMVSLNFDDRSSSSATLITAEHPAHFPHYFLKAEMLNTLFIHKLIRIWYR